MAENTKIEWAHHTFNPWRGCTKVSDGCKNCYAETLSGRNHQVLGVWGKNGTRSIAVENYWKQALDWDRKAKAAGERHRVFCGSLMDIFEGNDTMPKAAWAPVQLARRRLFLETIQSTPNLDWLLLTKRPENIPSILRAALDPHHEDTDWNVFGDPHGLDLWNFDELYPNVWLGTSVESREHLGRITDLAKTPATVHFVSIEPLLGDLGDISGYLEQLNNPWLIVGGESGTNARPLHPDWVRSIRDQCVDANVPFFFKQWGQWLPFGQSGLPEWHSISPDWPSEIRAEMKQTRWADGKPFQFIDDKEDPSELVIKVGKKKAGCLLDGREWKQFPEEKYD